MQQLADNLGHVRVQASAPHPTVCHSRGSGAPWRPISHFCPEGNANVQHQLSDVSSPLSPRHNQHLEWSPNPSASRCSTRIQLRPTSNHSSHLRSPPVSIGYGQVNGAPLDNVASSKGASQHHPANDANADSAVNATSPAHFIEDAVQYLTASPTANGRAGGLHNVVNCHSRRPPLH